ncbi:MAG TPA: hypothetical protein VFR41_11005, partial [Acidimicrobiia bacterium]|nr:hypothetical protein [Acidimicrobiia bacterium]
MTDRTSSRIPPTALLAILFAASLPAQTPQSLYMPRAVKRAFANGTRSLDGRPGPKYWQNHG